MNLILHNVIKNVEKNMVWCCCFLSEICKPGDFNCGDGSCVSPCEVCDGISQCLHSEADEQNCGGKCDLNDMLSMNIKVIYFIMNMVNN